MTLVLELSLLPSLVEIAISLVMERKVAKYPLGVCDVEIFFKLFSPIGTVEEAAGHSQMEVLYFVEVDGNVTFREVAIAYLVLTLCQSLHPWRHCSHVCKGFVAPH